MTLPKNLSFVDIETTGLSASYNRIIEIGILRVENDALVKKYSSLINPGTIVDPFITKMTGITAGDLENAPTFYEIKDELLEILDGSVFVAHNVRFDYGFLRNEFKRAGEMYQSKHFCSVRLARYLYPELPRYGLDSLIQNFNLEVKNRHRAYDDAKAIFDFYSISKKQIPDEKFSEAISYVLKKTTLPSGISSKSVEKLPEKPGVYIFYGNSELPLYIGKSVNIKERVMSHFSNDNSSRADIKLSQQAIDIEALETTGELGALLLESKMIKERQPLLNRKLRDSRKLQVIIKNINTEGFYTTSFKELGEISVEETANILGVFKSKKEMKEFLYELAREHQLCPKLLGIEKGKGRCFYSSLGFCKGACDGKEKTVSYNLRFEEAFFTKKVKPWRFDKPIGIKEVGEITEVHVIDKWCYLGTLRDENEDISELRNNYVFDYDTYKIIYRFLKNPKNHKKIVNLSFL